VFHWCGQHFRVIEPPQEGCRPCIVIIIIIIIIIINQLVIAQVLNKLFMTLHCAITRSSTSSIKLCVCYFMIFVYVLWRANICTFTSKVTYVYTVYTNFPSALPTKPVYKSGPAPCWATYQSFALHKYPCIFVDFQLRTGKQPMLHTRMPVISRKEHTLRRTRK